MLAVKTGFKSKEARAFYRLFNKKYREENDQERLPHESN